MVDLYKRIDDLCKQEGINVTIMCKEAKISRSLLSDLKSKRLKTLSAETLSKIADYFKVSIEYLLGKENTPKEITNRDIKFALFGGDADKITDEMYQDVLRYAAFIKERKKQEESK